MSSSDRAPGRDGNSSCEDRLSTASLPPYRTLQCRLCRSVIRDAVLSPLYERDMRAKPIHHLLPTFTVNVVLEGGKGGGHDITVMDLGAHDLDGFDPQLVNALDVSAGQVWRVSAERKSPDAAVLAEHDKTGGQFQIVRCAIPGL